MTAAPEPIVSVGMPVYNRLDGLKAALACVRNQTYRNLQIIVSDNCSPNPEIQTFLTDAAREDPRIVYVRQAENIGAWKNFCYVLNASSADYFMWAADDDTREPEFISACMAPHIANRTTGLTFTRFARVDTFGRKDADVIDITEYNGQPRWPLIRRIIAEPEIYGRVNCIYGIWNRRLLVDLMAMPFDWKFSGSDQALTLAAMARMSFHADERELFKKGGAGAANPNEVCYFLVDFAKPKPDDFLRFTRHPANLINYLVALRGTRFFAIGALLLGFRFVREAGWELWAAWKKLLSR